MKTAYQYIRISDEDQSNFSLSGQQKMNEEYAAKYGIQILNTFIDDGYSAKNFNRPNWKQLETMLSKNKKKVDYLIVTKYDRLIRNAAEGLAFIEKLEQTWEVKLLSVMENFFIDPHSPFFFKTRADLLVTAEFERRVISDRTRFGVWSAKSQGKFIGRAPLGYDNARDENDKPIILINKEKRSIVEYIYNEFISGTPSTAIAIKVKERGIPLKAHGAIQRILCNHTYAGLIKVPSYKEGIQKIVKGTHEPIVSEDTFWKAYYKIQDETRPVVMKQIDDNIPLRGFLMCEYCGHTHTGAKSKGKRKYYYYYWCGVCRGTNYNADKVHDSMEFMLENLSLKKPFIEALKIEIERQMEERLKDKSDCLKKVTREIEQLKERMHSLEAKYFDNKIGDDTYQKWHATYTQDLNRKAMEFSDLSKGNDKYRKLLNDRLPLVTDLNYIYNQADTPDKHQFLKGIFPGCLFKTSEGFRTPLINDMFYQNSLKIGALLEVKKEGTPALNANVPLGSPNENQIEHFLTIIDSILTRKIA